MLIFSLKYYSERLKFGEWVRLKSARRAKSRKLCGNWKLHLRGALRALNVAVRKGDENGRAYIEYKLPIHDLPLYLLVNFDLPELPKLPEINPKSMAEVENDPLPPWLPKWPARKSHVADFRLSKELLAFADCYPDVIAAVKKGLMKGFKEIQVIAERRRAKEQAHQELVWARTDERRTLEDPWPLKPVSMNSAIKSFVRRLVDS